jgi:hypothetical protein
MEDIETGLPEREQEEFFRAFGRFSGERSCIFNLPGVLRKRADKI